MRNFSDDEVQAIRDLVASGPRGTAKAIAEELGVPRSTISRLAGGVRRPNLTDGRGRPPESWGREPTWAAQFGDRLKPGPGGCLDFTGKPGDRGYGRVSVEGRPYLAHRASYALHHGIHPRDLGGHVLHACDRPICVNPAHLRTGTQGANMEDRDRRVRQAGKLTHEQVRELRRICAGGRVPYGRSAELRSRFGVTSATIRDVVQRKSWKHLSDE